MQYNEIAYAEKMMENGFIGHNYVSDLFILSKYLRHTKNFTKKEHTEYIKDFCNKYLVDYNEVLMGNKIDKIIENGRKLKNKPLVIESIPIYKEEMEKINSFDISNDYKKILLSMLFSKKITHEKAKQIHGVDSTSFYLGGNKKKYSEILKASKVQGKHNIHLVISDLVKNKIVISTYNGDVILDFMNGLKCEEILYEVKPIDFNCIGLYFDLYLENKRVKLCEECGRLIVKNARNEKYCTECSREKKLESKRITMQKIREKEKCGTF